MAVLPLIDPCQRGADLFGFIEIGAYLPASFSRCLGADRVVQFLQQSQPLPDEAGVAVRFGRVIAITRLAADLLADAPPQYVVIETGGGAGVALGMFGQQQPVVGVAHQPQGGVAVL
ncbi:hypothetical protein [Chitinivorax sp. B]|uniref:hypothetical protein n=1 Tax=Chitinivorax sp. B TaxID=2502235 RepID=UPI002017B65B|nr:hypothetical protein [Chitinivorax sp. B]